MAQFFTKREIRGIALLLPLLVMLAWVITEALHTAPPKPDNTPSPGVVFAQIDSINQALHLRQFDPNTVTYEELREIVADIGLLPLVQRYAPHCAIHASTQLGVVNYATASMLHDMGVSRVVLAREMTLDEIAELRAKTPSTLEIEAFVHGAMCMAVSSGNLPRSDFERNAYLNFSK